MKTRNTAVLNVLLSAAAFAAFAAVPLCAEAGPSGYVQEDTAEQAGDDEYFFQGSIEEPALEEQIREYFRAVSDGDSERAEALRGKRDERREQVIDIMKQHGFQEYDIIDIVIYPVGEDRYVLVSYALKIEGIEAAVPGLDSWIAERDGDHGWILQSGGENLSDAQTERLYELIDSVNEDAYDLIMEVSREFNEMLLEEPALLEWMETVSEELEEQSIKSLEKSSYIVKEGDCLWRIAEAELGGGWRWSDLYADNKSVIGEDPDYILPGMTLKLPAK